MMQSADTGISASDWCTRRSRGRDFACELLGFQHRARTRRRSAPSCTDAFQPYESAIDAGLYDRANHSQVVKLFSNRLDRVSESYKPAKFIAVQKGAVSGDPDLDRAGTSHIERKNGTLRQWCKRLTRLTYAFSRKWDNLKAALALHFAHYNFCRIHGSLRITPAMAAGISDHVWTLEELIA